MNRRAASRKLRGFMKLLRTIAAATLALLLSQVPALALDTWADARLHDAVAVSCCGAKCKRCFEAARRGERCTRCHEKPAAVPWKSSKPAAVAAKGGCPHHQSKAAAPVVDPTPPRDDEAPAGESRKPRLSAGPCSWPDAPATGPSGGDGARTVAAPVPSPVLEPVGREAAAAVAWFDFLPRDIP
ncbi:MAG: hypothetical protein KC466_02520, partial [Myxococcales bacterium]|nr:hypothetical protein [Myxococcales bacterium]